MGIIIVKNTTSTVISIIDLGINIPPNEEFNIYDVKDEIEVAKSNDIITLISNGKIIINDGLKDLDKSTAVRNITGHTIAGVTDISGKMRVHQTSRKLGLRICWSGVGDDSSNITKVGGGSTYIVEHSLGETSPEISYIDYNVVENETWLHEGYVTWRHCNLDTITLELVPRTTATKAGINTNYKLYGGYLIIPASGNGTIDLNTDITNPNNGMVLIPNNDLGAPPLAFWNADYNTATKHYENITPAPYGDGRYNMFAVEVVLAKFLNRMPLLGDGFIALNSSDTDQIGHGMRVKLTAITASPDHEWSVACLMCLHRKKST